MANSVQGPPVVIARHSYNHADGSLLENVSSDAIPLTIEWVKRSQMGATDFVIEDNQVVLSVSPVTNVTFDGYSANPKNGEGIQSDEYWVKAQCKHQNNGHSGNWLVLHVRSSPTELVVLLNLIRRADEKGESYPGLPRICKDTGIRDTRTVSKVVSSLVSKGLVTTFSEGIGRKTHYQLCPLICENVGLATDRSRYNNEPTTPANDAPSPLHEMHPKEYPMKEYPISKEGEPFINSGAHGNREDEINAAEDDSGFYSVRKEERSGNGKPLYQATNPLAEMNGYFQLLAATQKEAFDRGALRLRPSSEPKPGLEERRQLRCLFFETIKAGVFVIDFARKHGATALYKNTPVVNGNGGRCPEECGARGIKP